MFLLAGKIEGYKSICAHLLHFLKELLCHQVHKFSGWWRWGQRQSGVGLLPGLLRAGDSLTQIWEGVRASRRAARCGESWGIQGSCWLQCTAWSLRKWRAFYLLAASELTGLWPWEAFWVSFFFFPLTENESHVLSNWLSFHQALCSVLVTCYLVFLSAHPFAGDSSELLLKISPILAQKNVL